MSETPIMAQTHDRLSCTSARAICYWFAIFFITYGAALLAEVWYPVLHGYTLALCLGSAGTACIATFALYRPLHCLFTGPVLLLGGIAAAMAKAGLWSVDPRVLWPVIIIAMGAALALEHHRTRSSGSK